MDEMTHLFTLNVTAGLIVQIRLFRGGGLSRSCCRAAAGTDPFDALLYFTFFPYCSFGRQKLAGNETDGWVPTGGGIVRFC